MSRLRECLLGVLLVASPAPAQVWNLVPVEPGPGPLLLFRGADELVPGGAFAWYLADLAGGAPKVFLREGGEGSLSVICRLDLRRILVAVHEPHDGSFVIDLGAGVARRLADGAWTFVGVRGGDVFYLGDERRGDARLYARPWTTDGKPRVVADAQFQQVWCGNDHAVGVTRGDRPQVWAIDLLRNTGRRLLDLDGGQEAAWSLSASVAPDGRHCALGLPNGTLRVHAMADGALVREWSDIDLSLSVFSSFSPRLLTAFLDADTVVATESRSRGRVEVTYVTVRRSIRSGEVLDESEHDGNLCHEPPVRTLPLASGLWGFASEPSGERTVRGPFVVAGNDLFYRGGEQPVASRDPAWQEWGIEITPDDEFAVVLFDGHRRVLDVIDGRHKQRRRVFSGRTSDRIWLPAP